ncbi:MAG: universal stress protein [Pseudomonadota bacterium]
MQQFKNILYVSNPELKDDDAFKRAVSLAEHNQAQLTVVSIMEESPSQSSMDIQGLSIPQLQDAIKEKQLLQLQAMVTSLDEKSFQLHCKVLTGVNFLSLIQEVLRQKYDLLIKTADDEGFFDKLFTSSDMHLLRKCPCPVWLIKASQRGHYQKIMAAVDFDPFVHKLDIDLLNKQILDTSLALALSDISELHIAHVWSAYGESSMRSGLAYQPVAYVDAYVERIRAKHQFVLDKLVADTLSKSNNTRLNKLKPKIHMVKGLAKNMLPKIATEQKIDIVLMGTVGRTGVPGFIMGNTAETVLNRIDCSVLAVKPEGFVSPISL